MHGYYIIFYAYKNTSMNFMFTNFYKALLIIFSLLFIFAFDSSDNISFSKINIKVADIDLSVELADTQEKRALGLMNRTVLSENSGMLFVFEESRKLRFWMKNTLIPLDIAYADEEGRINSILSMEPLDITTDYSSSEESKYALEMNQGWFDKNDVNIGDIIQIVK